MTALYSGIRRHLTFACVLVAALGLSGSACKRQSDGRDTTTPGGETGGPGSTVELSRAQDEITLARCDMEERCKNVGPDRTYADRDQCTTKIREAWKDDLNFSTCTKGIDAAELDQCLTEIRNHECGNVIDNLSRMVQCRPAELCRD